MMRSLEEGFAPGHAKEAKEELEKSIPLARYAQPEEISNMVLFLLQMTANLLPVL